MPTSCFNYLLNKGFKQICGFLDEILCWPGPFRCGGLEVDLCHPTLSHIRETAGSRTKTKGQLGLQERVILPHRVLLLMTSSRYIISRVPLRAGGSPSSSRMSGIEANSCGSLSSRHGRKSGHVSLRFFLNVTAWSSMRYNRLPSSRPLRSIPPSMSFTSRSSRVFISPMLSSDGGLPSASSSLAVSSSSSRICRLRSRSLRRYYSQKL